MKTIKYTILLLFLFSCSTLNRKIASEHKYLRDCNEALGNMMTGYYRYARDFDEMMKRYVPVEGDNRKQFFERNGQISWSYGKKIWRMLQRKANAVKVLKFKPGQVNISPSKVVGKELIVSNRIAGLLIKTSEFTKKKNFLAGWYSFFKDKVNSNRYPAVLRYRKDNVLEESVILPRALKEKELDVNVDDLDIDLDPDNPDVLFENLPKDLSYRELELDLESAQHNKRNLFTFEDDDFGDIGGDLPDDDVGNKKPSFKTTDGAHDKLDPKRKIAIEKLRESKDNYLKVLERVRRYPKRRDAFIKQSASLELNYITLRSLEPEIKRVSKEGEDFTFIYHEVDLETGEVVQRPRDINWGDDYYNTVNSFKERLKALEGSGFRFGIGRRDPGLIEKLEIQQANDIEVLKAYLKDLNTHLKMTSLDPNVDNDVIVKAIDNIKEILNRKDRAFHPSDLIIEKQRRKKLYSELKYFADYNTGVSYFWSRFSRFFKKFVLRKDVSKPDDFEDLFGPSEYRNVEYSVSPFAPQSLVVTPLLGASGLFAALNTFSDKNYSLPALIDAGLKWIEERKDASLKKRNECIEAYDKDVFSECISEYVALTYTEIEDMIFYKNYDEFFNEKGDIIPPKKPNPDDGNTGDDNSEPPKPKYRTLGYYNFKLIDAKFEAIQKEVKSKGAGFYINNLLKRKIVQYKKDLLEIQTIWWDYYMNEIRKSDVQRLRNKMAENTAVEIEIKLITILKDGSYDQCSLLWGKNYKKCVLLKILGNKDWHLLFPGIRPGIKLDDLDIGDGCDGDDWDWGSGDDDDIDLGDLILESDGRNDKCDDFDFDSLFEDDEIFPDIFGNSVDSVEEMFESGTPKEQIEDFKKVLDDKLNKFNENKNTFRRDFRDTRVNGRQGAFEEAFKDVD